LRETLTPGIKRSPHFAKRNYFCEQSFEDTHAAILRLFQALPEIERIEIRVADPRDTQKVIFARTIEREDAFAPNAARSVRMRFKMLGVEFNCTAGDQLEPLP
jgi:hypothetical protein